MILFLLFGLIVPVANAHHYYGHGHCYRGGYYSSGSIYLIRSDYREDKSTFGDCDEYYLITKTTTNYYSNGSRRTYSSYNIINSKNSSVLIADCSFVQHFLEGGNHYFIVKQGSFYQIIDELGNVLTNREYKLVKRLGENRFLVKLNKLYGVINLQDEIVVPIKYKKFDEIGRGLFITNLNSYYGITSFDNVTLVRNEYDKISRMHEVYLLKYKGEYGLCDVFGRIILPADNDSIKKLGEYIVVKKDKKYSVYDQFGKQIGEESYRKVKLERNTLKVMPNGADWQELSTL